MKNNDWRKRMLALLLAACLLLSLAACGGGETGTDGETTAGTGSETSASSGGDAADSETEYGYLTQVLDLDVTLDWVSSLTLRDGIIYCCGETYNEQTQSYDYSVSILNEDGTLSQTVDLPYPGTAWYQTVTVGDDAIWAVTYEWVEETASPDEEEPAETEDDWTTAASGDAPADTADEDDWTISDTTDPENWGTEPEEAAASQEATEEITEELTEETEESTEADASDSTAWVYEEDTDYYSSGRDVYTLWQFDMNGQTVSQTVLEGPEDVDYFYVSYLAVDGSGDLLLVCDNCIMVYSPEVELQGTAQVDNWISGLTALADGTILINYYDEDYNEVMAYFDAGTLTLGDAFSLEGANTDNYYYTYYPGLDGSLYASSTSGLYLCDLETGTMEEVLSWLDWDVDSANLYGVVPLTDGDILALGYASLTDAVQSTLLTRVPASEIPARTQLTLGVSYLSYTVRRLVLSFNRENSDYRISVRDYSAYTTDENASGWLDQLEMDMLSGDCPDILYLAPNEVDLENYVRKGYLLDLYTLMSEDTVTKEDLVPSYLAAMEQDGGLYAISSGFYIQTLVAPASAANENGTWTMETFAELARNYTGDDQAIWNYMNREEVLATLLTTGASAFVDQETGQCHFDGEEFQALLELCMLFPEDYETYYTLDESLYSGEYVSDYERIRRGTFLVADLSIYSIDDMRYSAEALTDDLALVGYPSVPGSGAVMNVGSCFAVSAYSDYADAAWDFIATILTEEYAEQNVYQLSVLQSYMEKQAAAAMEKPYYYDENGDKVEYDDTVLTQDQVDYLLNIIENTQSLYRFDEEMINIVLEETAAYFAGQKDAETVAALIQDRVQTYLDEQG